MLIVVISAILVKTIAEVAAQKASHAARERSRRGRRKEQEWDVQWKKAVFAEKTKLRTVAADAAHADADSTSEEERRSRGLRNLTTMNGLEKKVKGKDVLLQLL